MSNRKHFFIAEEAAFYITEHQDSDNVHHQTDE
jgi:hypothetical protein